MIFNPSVINKDAVETVVVSTSIYGPEPPDESVIAYVDGNGEYHYESEAAFQSFLVQKNSIIYASASISRSWEGVSNWEGDIERIGSTDSTTFRVYGECVIFF